MTRYCTSPTAAAATLWPRATPPDYCDFLADLIDTQFSSRQEFCQATALDPGQLSRVLANRGDLSLKVLHQLLATLHARLAIQTEEEARTQTRVTNAAEAIAAAVGRRASTSPAA